MLFDRWFDAYAQSQAWLGRQQALSWTGAPSVAIDWDDLPAHPHFVWTPCFGDFQCARLQVPMDWQGDSTEANKTVEIAVIKVEATVPVTDERYGGAVVLNPGGPGGSGIDQVLKGGHAVRTILSAGPDEDPEHAKYFDILGFDPRGINNTRPLIACYPNHLEAAVSSLDDAAHGMIDSSDTSFDYLWAKKRAEAASCSERYAEHGIAKHMTTASVARDLVEIFERHAEWREKETDRLLSSFRNVASNDEKQAIRTRNVWRQGEEMVQYWGFSYGTILGATLCAMFPDRIHRAVLDGVADSPDYMAGGWATNLYDTDMTFVKLADHCFQGGKNNCALWNKDGPAAIAENIGAIITGLRSEPIPVLGMDGLGATAVTYNDLKRLILEIVYWPIRDFPKTAQILYDVGQKNGSSLAAWAQEQRPAIAHPLSKQCQVDGPYSPACFKFDKAVHGVSASSAIMCSDADGGRLEQTKDEFRAYVDLLVGQSALIGESWASIQLSCTAWSARPHWRYDGDFRSVTAHPILFAGNTIDPVTPIRNAFSMAERFQGAGILHQDSEGHCTYSGISLCSMQAIRDYFQTGKLPGAERKVEDWSGFIALCGTDRVPFDGYLVYSDDAPELPEGESDQELWEALLQVNKFWP